MISNQMDLNKGLTPEAILNKLRSDYLHALNDRDLKPLESLHRVLVDLQTQRMTVHEFLNRIAQYIYRQLNINSLSIGLKGDVDGNYHYVAFAGLRKQSEDALKNTSYTRAELTDTTKYHGREVSKYTTLYLADEMPFSPGEEETYNRPMMLAQKRRTLEDALEGDYLDVWIKDSRNDILGWIETSGTKLGKLPDATTILWLELVASMIGLVLTFKRS